MEKDDTLLDDAFWYQLCHRNRYRHHTRIRIRNQLVELFMVCRRYLRSATGNRGDTCIFPRIDICRGNVFWLEQSEQKIPSHFHLAGSCRSESLGIMDPRCKCLDAEPGRHDF